MAVKRTEKPPGVGTRLARRRLNDPAWQDAVAYWYCCCGMTQRRIAFRGGVGVMTVNRTLKRWAARTGRDPATLRAIREAARVGYHTGQHLRTDLMSHYIRSPNPRWLPEMPSYRQHINGRVYRTMPRPGSAATPGEQRTALRHAVPLPPHMPRFRSTRVFRIGWRAMMRDR